ACSRRGALVGWAQAARLDPPRRRSPPALGAAQRTAARRPEGVVRMELTQQIAADLAPVRELEGAVVLGLDPGFSNFGWAAVRLLPGGGERVLDVGCIRTDRGKGKVLVRDDDRRRAAEIARALLGVARCFEPAVLSAEAL